MGDLPDQRPRRHAGATRARRVTAAAASAVRASPSRVASGRNPPRTSRSTRASHSTPCVRSHSTWPGSRTARIQRRTVDSGRSSWAAIRRYPVPRALASNADPMTAVVSARRSGGRGGQQHVGDPAGAAAGPPRPQGQRGGAVVAHGAGAGVTPRAAAGGRIPGRRARRRPGRSRPERGRRSRSSRHGGGTAHEHGLPAPPAGGVSWCGSRSGPSAGRAGRVDTGRAATSTTRRRPPCALGLERAGSSSWWRRRRTPRAPVVRRHRQWRGSGPHIVILGGGQQPGSRRSAVMGVAQAWDPWVAESARRWNDANVVAPLPARTSCGLGTRCTATGDDHRELGPPWRPRPG